MFRQPTLKRSGTVLVRNDSRYQYKRSKSIPLQPRRYTTRTANKTEVKNDYGASGDIAVTADGVFNVYGGVPQGSSDHERDGSNITQLYQTLNMRLVRAPASPQTTCRIIYGIWKLPQQAPTVADILDDDGSNGPILWPLSTETSSNYHILSDEYINLPAMSAAGSLSSGSGDIVTNGTVMYYKRKFRYKKTQQYSASSGTSARDWLYFVLVISEANGECTYCHTYNSFFTDN